MRGHETLPLRPADLRGCSPIWQGLPEPSLVRAPRNNPHVGRAREEQAFVATAIICRS
jgi:hypothetical protein